MSNNNAKKLSDALLTAEKHLEDANFSSAYSIYLELSQKYNISAEIYNNLAICSHQLTKQQEAIKYISKALEIEPTNPLYVNQHAQFLGSYNIKDNFSKANQLFNKAIDLISENLPVENKLYINNCYANFLFNTGCCLAQELRTAQQQEAIKSFEKCLEYQPDNYKAYFNIACCYINLDDIETGVTYLKKTIEINNNHSQAHFALSQYYQQINELAKAEKHLKLSLDTKNINYANAEFNYGVLEQKRHNLVKALEHYKKCLAIDPEHFAACYNIGSIYQKQQNIPLAIDYYNKALAINPEDSTCKYLLSCLNNNKSNMQQAPTEYIETLFDSYAENFDNELLNNLHYKTPAYLYDIFVTHVTAVNNSHRLNILDLGCGTGLSGQLFRPIAARLTGVDISANMLAVASKKNIYHNLIKSDLNVFLQHKNPEIMNSNQRLNLDKKFDLIILADVLVYFGELDTLFQNIHNNLTETGYVLFSTELSDLSLHNINYCLNTSGRYSHTIDYINKIMQKFKLEIISCTTKVIRTQHDVQVHGLLYLVQSAPC